ncbi:dihydrofolate reductase family protein [Terribacillus sp. 179-K 1B1 HS]|uniref:dihydrofolate reductase family protein n=1 Tax=Terribacillus sp. 179-K 1B1 HS TaxID=3142388 RepID=UPI0039A2A18A
MQNIDISYIFGGKDSLNFYFSSTKTKKLFSIDKLMLGGGGVLNGSFLTEGLVDELSILFIPIADGATNSVTLFDTNASLTNQHHLHMYQC